MTISITHIDQVYVLQESLEKSRSKAAKRVLDQIDRNRSRWPSTGRWRTSPAFTIDATEKEAESVTVGLRRFIERCDRSRHWRAIEVARQLEQSVS